MTYNLTENQKNVARFLVEQVEAGNLPESFHLYTSMDPGQVILAELKHDDESSVLINATPGSFDALAEAKLIIQRVSHRTRVSSFGSSGPKNHEQIEQGRVCTLTGLIYTAVASNFAESSPVTIQHSS